MRLFPGGGQISGLQGIINERQAKAKKIRRRGLTTSLTHRQFVMYDHLGTELLLPQIHTLLLFIRPMIYRVNEDMNDETFG